MRRYLARPTTALITLTSLLALALSLGLAPASHAQTRSITVSADGKVSVTPDAVRINATVSVISDTSKNALTQANQSSSKVRAAFLANGLEKKDLKTQSINVYPEYNYTSDKGSTLIGYRATQSFEATVRNAANAGAVVDAIVDAGGDALQVNSVTPFILNAAGATASARENAVKNARTKAISYAKLLGVRLSNVMTLVEGSAPSFERPIYALDKSAEGNTVVDLGQQEVTVTVTVKWSIR